MSTSEKTVHDVAIVGYGPVGVTAANLLGAMGLSVLVIEREPSVYTRARAISTDEEVIRIWQKIGLSERLKADMLSERPIDFVDAAGKSFLNLAPSPRGHGQPPQMFIYQPAVEQVLRSGVERFPNVTVLLGRECLRQTQDADGVELFLLDCAAESVSRARARYVIAADGGSSATRSQLGIGFEGTTYEDRWVVIDTKVKNEWPEVDRLRFHCNPDRPAVDCPTPLGHHRWEFPVLAGDDEKELVTDAAVRRILSNQGIGPEHVDVLRAVVYSHHVRFATKWRAGRIFLAGDAAHVMPPWLGQGMAAGVRDVANLCWKLAGVLKGELEEGILDTYEMERQPHVRKVTQAAVNIGRIITERNRAVAGLRDPILRAVMRIPGLGTYIRGAEWFPDAKYPSGFLAPAANARGSRRPKSHLADGWQIPQPWVLDSAGSRVRFDDAVPAGWIVLQTPGASRKNVTEPWAQAGVPVLVLHGPGEAPAPNAVVDTDGVLLSWFKQQGVDVVALRPDGFIYTSAAARGSLAKPPFRTVMHPQDIEHAAQDVLAKSP